LLVKLAYGEKGLTVDLPDCAQVLRPREWSGLADEAGAIEASLADPIGGRPLAELLRPEQRVVLVFSDITRPMPSERVLPPLLRTIERVVPRERITLLNGLGTHRLNTRDELVQMLGEEIVSGYRIEQHDARDEANLVALGRTRAGGVVQVNRSYQEADVRILTGLIEPHFFAGFSGGPKAVLPGIAGIACIMDNHGFARLRDPHATWGRTHGNPVWEEMREAAAMAAPTFLVNITVNRERAITGVYAGHWRDAHARGVEAARRHAMVAVDAPYDVVVSTNSGFPLDLNLYQSVKGMSCAAQIVKPGGTIVMATECRYGVPADGAYGRLVREAGSIEAILRTVGQPGFCCQDQWQAQIQARIMQKARVVVYSEGLDAETLEEMLFESCDNLSAAVREAMDRHGPEARLCVLPEGPQTIPYLA